MIRLLVFCSISLLSAQSTTAPDRISQAIDRMYRLQFPAAQALVDSYISEHPSDPLGYSVRAATYLFSELDRMSILESEFFGSDKRIAEKKGLKPNPATKEAINQAIRKARELSTEQLAKKPNDQNALFAICMAAGLQSDYMALVEKRQLASLSVTKESHGWALKLLDANPKFYDAYLTTGLSEYLLGSVPFFVKWFVRFDKVEGSKTAAVRNLELVATQGRYFGPFARVLLAVAHLREKRFDQAEQYLAGLARDFPENPLYQRELKKLQDRRRNAR